MHGRTRRELAVWAAGGAGALTATAALLVVLVHGSLLVPAVDAAVETGGVLVLAAWLFRTTGTRLRLRIAALVAGALAADVLAVVVLRDVAHVPDHVPPSFHVWVGLLGAGVAALLSSRRSPRRLLASAGALVAFGAGGFLLVNQHYAYFPTVASVAGARSADHVSLGAFRRVSATRSDGGSSPSHGVVVSLDAAPTVSHLVHRPGEVWLPPAWFTADRSGLPVVVLLAGTPGSPVAWDRSGLAIRAADAYARQHHGIAPVMVLTDENGRATSDTECVDGPLGNAETYLTVDVPAFVHDRLGIDPDPRRWAVVGFSEGGTCALELALRHPDVYRSFVDLAGDSAPNLGSVERSRRVLFGGSAAEQRSHDPDVLTRHYRYASTWGWFGVGRGDRRHVAVTADLARDARSAGMRTTLAQSGGGHDWTFARLGFARVLPALADHLSSSPQT